MAYSNNSLTVGKLRGSLGKELVFRDWDGKTVVAKSPKRRKTDPTAKQLVVLDKFELASQYAIGIMNGTDQALLQAYEDSRKKRQNLYSRIMQDYLKPPVVKIINTRDYTGAVGSTISILAKDDFKIKRVIVEIHAANGTLLETGNAVLDPNNVSWTYTATQANDPLTGSKIKAIAIDIPNNEGMLEITL